jgi:methionine-rich copper-binding protein CopC
MRKQLFSVAIGLLSLLAMAIQANAHAFMVRAEPRVGSKVKKAPAEVRIWFSESVRPGLSRVKVFDQNGKQVDKKNTHFDQGNRAVLDVSLAAQLAPGTYKVLWRVTSTDTHVTNGDFRFHIAGTKAAAGSDAAN